MGPLENVKIVEPVEKSDDDKDTSVDKVEPFRYAFVEYADECSVLFACEMLQDVVLFGKRISIKPRSDTKNVSICKFLRIIIYRKPL